MGRINFKPLAPKEFRYAVGVRDVDGLWLALWIRRSPKPEVFIMHPTGDSVRDVHTSYHADGTLHMKSCNRVAIRSYKRQPLNGAFRGTEHVFAHSGFAPRYVGTICDPADFTAVLEVPAGILGAHDGSVSVDLIEPGKAATSIPWSEVVMRSVFRQASPWLVVTIRRNRATILP